MSVEASPVGCVPEALPHGRQAMLARLDRSSPLTCLSCLLICLRGPSVCNPSTSDYLIGAQVKCVSDGSLLGHAIVYDAWRRLLFIGGGDWDERQTNGTLLIDADDKSDPTKLAEYLFEHFGLHDTLDSAYAVLVNKKRVSDTSHV